MFGDLNLSILYCVGIPYTIILFGVIIPSFFVIMIPGIVIYSPIVIGICIIMCCIYCVYKVQMNVLKEKIYLVYVLYFDFGLLHI